MKKHKLGKHGENIAVCFLKKKHYDILETNWRFKHKEIDIIALFENILIFVEVKTRSGKYLEEPYFAVTKKKQSFIIEAANAFITKYEFDYEVRFDVISIISSGDSYKIEHIEDAFYPTVK